MRNFILVLVIAAMFGAISDDVWAGRCPPGPVAATGATISGYGTDDGAYSYGAVASGPRFTNNGGVIVDNLTGLEWNQDADQYYATYSQDPTLAQAFQFCDNLSLDGFGWRVPNFREIFSLVDFSNASPALPSSHPFYNVRNDYWTSTHYYDSGTSDYWYLIMSTGAGERENSSATHPVWCVREHTTGCSCGGSVILVGN